MYLGNDLIETMPLNFTRLSEPGYLGRFKRILKQKHWDAIQQTEKYPEYIVVNLQTNYATSTISSQVSTIL
jgi:hypothetical protein